MKTAATITTSHSRTCFSQALRRRSGAASFTHVTLVAKSRGSSLACGLAIVLQRGNQLFNPVVLAFERVFA